MVAANYDDMRRNIERRKEGWNDQWTTILESLQSQLEEDKKWNDREVWF